MCACRQRESRASAAVTIDDANAAAADKFCAGDGAAESVAARTVRRRCQAQLGRHQLPSPHLLPRVQNGGAAQNGSTTRHRKQRPRPRCRRGQEEQQQQWQQQPEAEESACGGVTAAGHG